MEIKNRTTDPILRDAEEDLMSLSDLQSFLEEELRDSADITTDFSKAFQPINEGLGFHERAEHPPIEMQKFPAELPKVLERQPAAKEHPQSPQAPGRKIVRIVDESLVEEAFENDSENVSMAIRKPTNRLKSALSGEEVASVAIPTLDAFARPNTPPPLPKAGAFRRILAGLFDQLFIGTICCLGLASLLNTLSNQPGFNTSLLLHEIGRPETLKYLILCYLAVWFAYLTLGVGIMGGTLGMWIWGIKIEYGNQSRLMKKITRVGLSLFFHALILPTLVLVFQRNKKNVIDLLSGSEVHRNQ